MKNKNINDITLFRYLFCLDKRDLPQSILNWLVNYGSLVSSDRENAIKELSTLRGNCRKFVSFSKAFVDTMDKSYMKFTQFHMDILKELDNENGVVRSHTLQKGVMLHIVLRMVVSHCGCSKRMSTNICQYQHTISACRLRIKLKVKDIS